MDYDYYRQAVAGRPLPLAWVDLDLFDANADDIAAGATQKSVRVASKSIRCRALLGRVIDSSPVFNGVMCFRATEAAWLAERGFDNLLVAYPAWQASDVNAVLAANHEGAWVTLMVDSAAHVEHLASIASRERQVLPICVDVDMSSDYPGLRFGVLRSPASSWAQVRPIVELIQASEYLEFDGIMGYEAQIAGVTDADRRNRVKNPVIRALKKRSIREVARRRAEIVDGLTEMGISPRIVNGGGTGSLATTAREQVVTEVTVGSGFYSPGLFDHYRDLKYRPAAGFALEVVRVPAPGIFTCLGGGYIASGGTGADKQPTPYLPEGASLTQLEGAGEVQTPVRYDGSVQLGLGDPVFFRHAKAGELCERFDSLALISNGEVVDEVPTYRGESRTFL